MKEFFIRKIIIFYNFWIDVFKRLGEEFRYLEERSTLNPRIILWRLRLVRIWPLLSKHFLKIVVCLVTIFSFFISFYTFAWRAPSNFPEQSIVEVDTGTSLSQIADTFEKERVVRSSFWLKTFMFVTGGDRRIIAGEYFFPKPTSVFGVVKMLHKGEFGIIPVRVTIFEGKSSFEIAEELQKVLFRFDSEEFLKLVDSGKYEGYLFPDTYFFMQNTKAIDVIEAMRENFARQIKIYEEDIMKSGRPLEELVIMASIIEGEGNTLESKRLISGILWRRMKIDMLLQVDAPFRYYNGKHSYTLTKEDLGEDHPYNTYVNKGLPPTAITNPGIDSLRAAIAPTNTDYLFFMSDKQGNTYYAKDFDGHQSNREKYLR